jgi:hypothetical protein
MLTRPPLIHRTNCRGTENDPATGYESVPRSWQVNHPTVAMQAGTVEPGHGVPHPHSRAAKFRSVAGRFTS